MNDNKYCCDSLRPGERGFEISWEGMIVQHCM